MKYHRQDPNLFPSNMHLLGIYNIANITLRHWKMQNVGRLCYPCASALNKNLTAWGQTLLRGLLLNSPHSGQCSDKWAASQHLVSFPLLNVWPQASFTKHYSALNIDSKCQSDSCPFIHLSKQGIAYWHLGKNHTSVPHNFGSWFLKWASTLRTSSFKRFSPILV